MKAISLSRPFTSGVGIPTQWYGQNPQIYKKLGYPYHQGIDYSCIVGTPILAMHDGIIITAKLDDPIKFNGGYGLYIRVGDDGYNTIYAHLSQLLVNLNDVVARGQVIGLSGNTGNSTGPHAHIALRITGINIAPATVQYDPMQGYVNMALFRDYEV